MRTSRIIMKSWLFLTKVFILMMNYNLVKNHLQQYTTKVPTSLVGLGPTSFVGPGPTSLVGPHRARQALLDRVPQGLSEQTTIHNLACRMTDMCGEWKLQAQSSNQGLLVPILYTDSVRHTLHGNEGIRAGHFYDGWFVMFCVVMGWLVSMPGMSAYLTFSTSFTLLWQRGD